MTEQTLSQVIDTILERRQAGHPITLLAVCPNSEAVLEAGVMTAARHRIPLLFAATLNQVDRDGGYTGWTAQQFVERMHTLAEKYGCTSGLYPCLDHGGPWMKDRHTLEGLSYARSMAEVKLSLTACLQAGYALLHIDPTVDRRLPPGTPPSIADVVKRTLELIAHSEEERTRLGLPPVVYEVGTEEVHGGLVDLNAFGGYLNGLRQGLEAGGLLHAWPRFIVAKVGTDLHTTFFSAEAAREAAHRVEPFGSVIKGHYTDWVENPQDYPASGMGGANVGPEFTAAEYHALKELEQEAGGGRDFLQALQGAVLDSGRWRKWLQPGEMDKPFTELASDRQDWLLQTGARYVWTVPAVVEARARLYARLQPADAHARVLERIAAVMDTYVKAFGLEGLSQ